mmetsp:Transcript_2536/g.5461  ORF Transcript_2536/g.5461 Transcript_2536/m.5461 type:complete len:99 (+) Transcript_2536:552-848(+)
MTEITTIAIKSDDTVSSHPYNTQHPNNSIDDAGITDNNTVNIDTAAPLELSSWTMPLLCYLHTFSCTIANYTSPSFPRTPKNQCYHQDYHIISSITIT